VRKQPVLFPIEFERSYKGLRPTSDVNNCYDSEPLLVTGEAGSAWTQSDVDTHCAVLLYRHGARCDAL